MSPGEREAGTAGSTASSAQVRWRIFPATGAPMISFRRAIKTGRFVTVALSLVLCTAVGSARAQVLDQVPSDALLVVKINHMDQTSTKLGELMQALGVVEFAPPMADPLGALQTKAGFTNGLDKTGEAAIVMINGPWTNGQNNDKAPTIILLPVSDYKAFLANTTVSATDGDISTVRVKDNPEDVFVTNWGNYAALSPSKDNLAKKPDGLKPTGMAAKQLTEKDAVIFINMPAVKSVLLPKLQENRDKILAKVKDAMASNGQDPSKGALVNTLVTEALDGAQRLLEDTQAVTVSFAFSKTGVNETVLAEFTPDSYMGKLATQIKGTDGPLLAGLPATKYLFYMGGIQDPQVALQVFNDITGPLSKTLADMGEQGKTIQDAIDSYKDAFGSIEGSTFGMVAPTGPVGQGALFQFLGVYKADAEKLKAAQVKQIEAQNELMKALGAKGSQGMTTSVTPNAKTVDGVSFDQVRLKFNMAGNTPEQMQINQMMNIMYGPGGFSMYTGVVDPKTLLFASGISDELLGSALTVVKANANPMGESDPVKQVDAELPKTRSAVIYIPLDVIVSTAVGYAQQFGMPLPVQLPPNLPPIGISAGTDGSALRVDTHVPTQLVQSLVQAGMQFYLQHGGQPNNGGNGL
jgi:hypothetical protein